MESHGQSGGTTTAGVVPVRSCSRLAHGMDAAFNQPEDTMSADRDRGIRRQKQKRAKDRKKKARRQYTDQQHTATASLRKARRTRNRRPSDAHSLARLDTTTQLVAASSGDHHQARRAGLHTAHLGRLTDPLGGRSVSQAADHRTPAEKAAALELRYSPGNMGVNPGELVVVDGRHNLRPASPSSDGILF